MGSCIFQYTAGTSILNYYHTAEGQWAVETLQCTSAFPCAGERFFDRAGSMLAPFAPCFSSGFHHEWTAAISQVLQAMHLLSWIFRHHIACGVSAHGLMLCLR